MPQLRSATFPRRPSASLQAADLPTALHGLLGQAATQLKPPRAGAPVATAAAAASAFSRPALVLGLLLVLERASAVAQQQRDVKLVKVRMGLRKAPFSWEAWPQRRSYTLCVAFHSRPSLHLF